MASDRVIVVGPFPPPVHGASLATAAFVRELEKTGARVSRINVAAKSLDRSLFRRLQGIPRILSGLVQTMFKLKRKSVLYLSVAGGSGQLYDILFLVAARFIRAPIVLHHHSYAYLSKRSLLTQILLTIAGQNSKHVVQCGDMREKLQSYRVRQANIATIPNAFAVTPAGREKKSPKSILTTIGFLSNISEAKGIFEFLAILEALASSESVTGLIAGRFEDEAIKRRVTKRVNVVPNALYLGPLDQSGKADFFTRIDVLVFPTKYVNEADPLTLHEAMAWGVPVIASARGCIQTLISTGGGLSVKLGDDFVAAAVEQIKAWMVSPAGFQAASAAASSIFDRLRQLTSESLRDLLSTELILPRHKE